MAYVDIRALQQRISLLETNARLQRDSLALAQDRFDNGLSSQLDVAQAQANLSATLASIPSLEISLNHALNRLAVLLGQDAGSLHAEFSTTEDLPAPDQSLGTGVPADVLRQRPDIRRAETIACCTDRQDRGRHRRSLPPFWTGRLFWTAIDLTFQSARQLEHYLGSESPVQWNIFSGGRVRSNIEVQDEKAQQRLLQYEQKVLAAIEEVENAIVAYNQGQLIQRHIEDSVAAIIQAEELVLVQYDTGLTDFNNVLVTQRDLTSQQDQLVITQAQILVDLIALYKALGGGWDIENPRDFSRNKYKLPRSIPRAHGKRQRPCKAR